MYKRIIELAKDLITECNEKKDIFNQTYVLFDNILMEHWFKSFWLNNNDDIFMNIKGIRFNDLYSMIFDINKNNIASKSVIRDTIIQIASNEQDKNKYQYIYDNDVINSNRLIDFASELACLFIEYDNDLFDFSNNDWQFDLYNNVKEILKNKHYYLIREFLEKDPNEIKGDVYIFISRKLSNLERSIIDKYNDACTNKIVVYELEDIECDLGEKEVIGAANITREIEVLHTNISNLIKDKKAKLSDIVVYAPSVEKYSATINHIFNQEDRKYPNIPYIIKSHSENDFLNALNIIFRIVLKGYCSRRDLIDLTNNDYIKIIYKLENNESKLIKDILVETNNYRENNDDLCDFKDLKNRLLVTRFVGGSSDIDNIVELSKEILPYDNLSISDDFLVKFFNLIDNIIYLLNNIKIDLKLTNENIILFKHCLLKLLDSDELDDKNYLLNEVNKEIALYEYLKLTDDVDLRVLMNILLDISNVPVLNGTPFINGITFIDINEKNIVNTKYAFLIGLNSKDFPKLNKKSELDINSIKKSITEIDKSSFNKIINNSDNVYLSFINKDVQTNEDCYPSSVIDNLRIVEISLDEKRDWSDLFTKRETVNKDYYNKLLDQDYKDLSEIVNNKSSAPNHTYISQELPISLSISKLKDYLVEPLKYKASRLFNIYHNKNDEVIDASAEYEDITPSILNVSNMTKDTVIDKLINKGENIKDIEKEYELKKLIPNNIFKQDSINGIEVITDAIESIISNNLGDYNCEVLSPLRLSFNINDVLKQDFNNLKEYYQTIIEKKALGNIIEVDENDFRIYGFSCSDEIINWELYSNDYVCYKEDGNSIIFIELKNHGDKERIKLNKTISLFLQSLKFVANKQNKITYKIKLLFCTEGNLKEDNIFQFDITSKEAVNLLNRIYINLNNFAFNVAAPYKEPDMKKKIPYEDYFTITNIREELKDNSWKYFKDGILFNDNDLINVIKDGKALSIKKKEEYRYYFFISHLKINCLLEKLIK